MKIDLTGQLFGDLKVIDENFEYKADAQKRRRYWNCMCSCGKLYIAEQTALRAGKCTKCYDCARRIGSNKRRTDITGNTYGFLTVDEMLYDYNGSGNTYCSCSCVCGKHNIIKNVYQLINKSSRFVSCGCKSKEKAQSNMIAMTGQRYGRLIVNKEFEDMEGIKRVSCTCDCGTETILRRGDVLAGVTKSCGCLHRERTTESNTKDWTGYVSKTGIKAIDRVEQNTKGQWLWNFECPICGNVFKCLPANIADGSTSSCGCKKTSSKEKIISTFLTQNNISFVPQYPFPDCRSKYVLKFDFALVDENDQVKHLIEYDGKQHFEPIDYFGGVEGFKDLQKRDKIKNQYCIDNNIPLLRLPYYLTDEQIYEKITNIIYP